MSFRASRGKHLCLFLSDSLVIRALRVSPSSVLTCGVELAGGQRGLGVAGRFDGDGRIDFSVIMLREFARLKVNFFSKQSSWFVDWHRLVQV